MVVRAFLGISLGKLRLLMGPLAWLAQSPILASVPAAGSAAASTAVTAAVTATMVASGVVPAAVDMAPDVQSLSVVADEDLPFDLAMVSVNVTLLGTPSPTATLVPTPKPAPTATSTPTAIPAGPMLYLTNPGSGDTASSALLTLAGTLPTAGSLPNYDTDRDADPGLVLIRGSGAGDPDPARRQFWGAVTGPAEALVEAKLKIYAATKDFAVGFGTVDVSVARCDVLLSSCETLGTGSSDFSQGGSHVFKQITVNVLLAGGPTPARPFLRLSVAPSATSASDLWLAYDTAAQPSYLTLS